MESIEARLEIRETLKLIWRVGGFWELIPTTLEPFDTNSLLFILDMVA